jgi:hypothetical protein
MEYEAQLKIRVKPDQLKRLNVKTAEEGIAVSVLLRAAIEDYLTGKYKPMKKKA